MTIIDKDTKFTATNDEGKEIEYEVLFTFDSDETNKSYKVYTDGTRNEEGNINVYASTYDPTGKSPLLQPIETDEEWKIIEVILNTLQEEIQKKKTDNKEGKDDENIELWISEVEEIIDLIDEDDELDLLFPCMSQIMNRLLDEKLMEYTESLFSLLKKVQEKATFSYESNVNLGMKAYRKKNYHLAELAFKDAGAKNNLAYIIRRGEVKDPSKYNDKFVADLLKEGVYEKEPFSMINMSLLWALNIGGEEAWKLADGIMSNIPQEDLSFAYDWWLEVGRAGEIEGYLVHYWLLKYGKISTSQLGTKDDIRKRLSFFIKEMPSYI